MLGREADASAVRHPDRHGDGGLPAGHVAVLRELVGDLVEAHAREVGEHDLRDGPQTGDGGSECAADDRLLRDRRVADAAGTEAVEEPSRRLEHAARGADVLAEQEDPFVSLELLLERPDDPLSVRELAHA